MHSACIMYIYSFFFSCTWLPNETLQYNHGLESARSLSPEAIHSCQKVSVLTNEVKRISLHWGHPNKRSCGSHHPLIWPESLGSEIIQRCEDSERNALIQNNTNPVQKPLDCCCKGNQTNTDVYDVYFFNHPTNHVEDHMHESARIP